MTDFVDVKDPEPLTPFCGYLTCVVRGVLNAAQPDLRRGIQPISRRATRHRHPPPRLALTTIAAELAVHVAPDDAKQHIELALLRIAGDHPEPGRP